MLHVAAAEWDCRNHSSKDLLSLLPAATLQVTSFQALQAAIQHPLISSDTKTVCSLLQTCKSWRAAMQQCAGGNLHISIGSTMEVQCIKGLQKLALFCSWLQQHGALVSLMEFVGPFSGDAEERNAYCDTAARLLVLSLQEARGHGATLQSAAAAGLAGMQLRSFGTECIRTLRSCARCLLQC
jgi:hypothetical protein